MKYEHLVEVIQDLSVRDVEHILICFADRIVISTHDSNVLHSLDVDDPVRLNGPAIMLNTQGYDEHGNRIPPNYN